MQGVDDDVADTALAVCDTDIKRQPGKNIGAAVITAVNEHYKGNKGGTNYVGTLKNGGVQISTLDRTEEAWTSVFGSLVTAELKAEVEALKAAIIDGSVKVSDYFTAE